MKSMILCMSRRYQILQLLDNDGLLLEEIADKLDISYSNTRALLYMLRKEGLLSNSKGRFGMRIWTLTAKGKNVLDLYHRKMTATGGGTDGG